MKLANLALVSTMAVFGAAAIGCASNSGSQPGDLSSDGSLSSSESQLVADNDEAQQVDDDLESGLEEPLSGASDADPGTPPDAATSADLMEKVRTNPGRFFKPAGCITTTIDGNKATHVFKDCTGPYGLAKFNGTVVSTYELAGGKLTITHEATNFQIDGATISGKRTVVYSRSGAVVTRTRTGDWSGTSGSGNPISHEANFTSTWDPTTKCITRDGTATTGVGDRSLDVAISGYERCGIGHLGCPESGKITLTRTKGGDGASLTIEFQGGTAYTVTRPNGTTVNRHLICKPAS